MDLVSLFVVKWCTQGGTPDSLIQSIRNIFFCFVEWQKHQKRQVFCFILFIAALFHGTRAIMLTRTGAYISNIWSGSFALVCRSTLTDSFHRTFVFKWPVIKFQKYSQGSTFRFFWSSEHESRTFKCIPQHTSLKTLGNIIIYLKFCKSMSFVLLFSTTLGCNFLEVSNFGLVSTTDVELIVFRNRFYFILPWRLTS